MCNHEYANPYIQSLPSRCTLSDWYDSADTSGMAYPELLYDSQGRCIFHSTDRKWKLEQHCGERFAELFRLMALDEQLAELDFREVVLMGQQVDASIELPAGTAAEGEQCIYLGGLQCTKPIRFQGARFFDKLILCDLHCTESVDFDQAVFKSVVALERCAFEGYLSFFAGCRFEHNFSMQACQCEETVSFDEAVFMQQIHMSDVHFMNGAIFRQAQQIADDLICIFAHIAFDGYTSFAEGGFRSSVSFDSCRFGAEVNFENTVFRQRLQITDPIINEKVFFNCSRPGAKLFEKTVEIEASADSFGEAGLLVFQNANLFNLNPDFKAQLRSLEMAHKVEIREGCLLYRTSIERVFDDVRLHQFLLEDLAKAFARFFEARHTRSLQVDVVRDLKAEKIRVVFHTDEAMSIPEFEALLQGAQGDFLRFSADPNTENSPPDSQALLDDCLLQLSGLWQRFAKAQALPLLSNFFEAKEASTAEDIPKLLEVSVHLHLKNAVINSRIETGGGFWVGDG